MTNPLGQYHTALSVVMLALAMPSAAMACGPTDQWYFENTTIVIEGRANCDMAKRSCRIRVQRVVKTPINIDIDRRTIEVDYQDWYAENPLPEGSISIRCGHPRFEPEESEFRARFYGDVDPRSGELIVRTHRLLQSQDD